MNTFWFTIPSSFLNFISKPCALVVVFYSKFISSKNVYVTFYQNKYCKELYTNRICILQNVQVF